MTTYLYLAALFAIGVWAIRKGHERNVPDLSDDALDTWAEAWCAEHVDPYLPQIEGSDWDAWESEMAGGER